MIDFEEYIRQGEPNKQQRAYAWRTAIGLQAVDGLTTSDYLKDTARKHIEGDIDIDEAQQLIKSYYKSKTSKTLSDDESQEADIVSSHIAKILGEQSFAFSIVGITSIHRRLFEGVFKFAGQIRNYDITKKEWVLNGDTVLYVNSEDITRALEYDLEQERQFVYTGLSPDQMVEHIARFVSGIWQIHPFAEGNTRTTAVFIIKYLRSIGFNVENELFANNSWYFRNALVRANYRNTAKGVEPDLRYLIQFFRNLLMGESNELKNRQMSILNIESAQISTPPSTPPSKIVRRMKKIDKWKTLKSEYLIRRPWLTARRDAVELPDGRVFDEFYILEYPAWVNVTAITPEGRYVMVRQYRHGLGEVFTELCAGVVEDGEEPLAAAQRELLEETGFGGGKWSLLNVISANPSANTNLTYCYLAEGVTLQGNQHLDPSEDIAVELLEREEVLQMLRTDSIKQSLMAVPLWHHFYDLKGER